MGMMPTARWAGFTRDDVAKEKLTKLEAVLARSNAEAVLAVRSVPS
jgi:hypothetical protein